MSNQVLAPVDLLHRAATELNKVALSYDNKARTMNIPESYEDKALLYSLREQSKKIKLIVTGLRNTLELGKE